MMIDITFFFLSFVADILAYIYYQTYIDSGKKDTSSLILAVVSAFSVWFFIFKLQDRGQVLRVFLPLWASGSAIFGYFATGMATKTPAKELFSMPAILSIGAIGVGLYFLTRMSVK
jgi:hypothetical protein